MSSKQSEKNTEERYLAEIRGFFNSEAWREYALPLINQSVQGELPKPSEKGWQERYVYAHALATCLSMLINTLSNLSNKKEYQKAVDKFLKGAIDEA